MILGCIKNERTKYSHTDSKKIRIKNISNRPSIFTINGHFSINFYQNSYSHQTFRGYPSLCLVSPLKWNKTWNIKIYIISYVNFTTNRMHNKSDFSAWMYYKNWIPDPKVVPTQSHMWKKMFLTVVLILLAQPGYVIGSYAVVTLFRIKMTFLGWKSFTNIKPSWPESTKSNYWPCL